MVMIRRRYAEGGRVMISPEVKKLAASQQAAAERQMANRRRAEAPRASPAEMKAAQAARRSAINDAAAAIGARKYSDGGKVQVTPESRERNRLAREKRMAAAKKSPQPIPTEALGTGALSRAADRIKNARREKEEALGLRDGGRVRRR